MVSTNFCLLSAAGYIDNSVLHWASAAICW